MSDSKKIYLAVSEFAQAAKVSRQAVYLRLDKDLSSYCKVIDGRKMIHSEALSLYSCQVADQSPCKDDVKQQDVVSSNMSSYLMSEVERLRQELKDKEEKVAEKDAVIADKDRQIASYSDKFIALSEKQTELIQREQEISAKALMTTGQAQLLHANTQDGKLQGEKDQIEAQETITEKQAKKGFFARLFSN